MNLHFEGFAAGLIDVRALHDGEGAALGREGDRAADVRTGADGGVNDLLGALVDDAVVVGLEADADGEAGALGSGLRGGFLGFCHGIFLSCSITS